MATGHFLYLDNPSDEYASSFKPVYLENVRKAMAFQSLYSGDLILKSRWQVRADSDEPVSIRGNLSKVTIAAYYEEDTGTAVSLIWENGFYVLSVWDGPFDIERERGEWHHTKLREALEELSGILCTSYNLANFLSFGEEEIGDFQVPVEKYGNTDYGKWA